MPASPSLIGEGASEVELRAQLREAYRVIKAKDEALEEGRKDLSRIEESNQDLYVHLANVLTENAELQHALRSQQQQHISHPQAPHTPETPTNAINNARRAEASAAAHIADLQRSILDLQSRNEQLKIELQRSQDAEKSMERRVKGLQNDNESTHQQAEAAMRHSQELEAERKQWVKERTELVRRMKEAQDAAVSDDAEVVEELKEAVRQREEVIEILQQRIMELEGVTAEAVEERTQLEERYQELSNLAEELRNDKEQQSAQIDDLVWALESARDLINKLQARLAVLEPARDGAPDAGDKTLFSEVEDKRKDLENRHQYLAQRHAGLVKKHHISVYQQQRMRHHIARLTQLSSGPSAEQQVAALQAALSQCKSENQELLNRIGVLEKNQEDINGLNGTGVIPTGKGDGPPASAEDYEVELECLRLRITHLSAENERMRNELRTERMLKSFETEKLGSALKTLRERENDLQKLKAHAAHVKFQLEESNLKIQRMQEENNWVFEVEGVGVGRKVTMRHQSQQTEEVELEDFGTQTDDVAMRIGISQWTQTDPEVELEDSLTLTERWAQREVRKRGQVTADSSLDFSVSDLSDINDTKENNQSSEYSISSSGSIAASPPPSTVPEGEYSTSSPGGKNGTQNSVAGGGVGVGTRRAGKPLGRGRGKKTGPAQVYVNRNSQPEECKQQ
ncbi:Protein Spindly [Borealophlyctis nickersoniae]|nr:Protein Spindly [Borealophlyctis nickersoniae]